MNDNFLLKRYHKAEKMTKYIMIPLAAVMLASCSPAAKSPAVPEVSSYKALEITADSNSARIARLETELDKAKSDVETLRVQNRQLADSYESLVGLFKEHRNLTLTIIEKVNSLTAPAETK
jgi:TolA-binding protein